MLVPNWEPCAKTSSDLVYVALREDGAALKIGATGGTLHYRWYGILRLLNADVTRHSYRPNEWDDRASWLHHLGRQPFEVWLRPAAKVSVSYLTGYERTLSLRHAEEDYLDAYYCPLIGKSLDTRKKANAHAEKPHHSVP
ncbi:hypothetical protein [Hyphomicrobium sp. D-2]|uniref:hypothetical protein n=1 Tax=Hyphomicrobium sp. D-2 TaxID=3041621 RepID=UPI0024561D94|nr:hypothetical protein [Hyphomicrobium sp. D-2]MDH4983471.1 hypothetical protein [Hyphomicrobium sp. D-2]